MPQYTNGHRWLAFDNSGTRYAINASANLGGAGLYNGAIGVTIPTGAYVVDTGAAPGGAIA